MSYKALYRKYRPISFSDVISQDYIVKTIKNSIISDHISHAYLFTGPRGTGKTTIAKIFARAINCEHAVDGNPCNSCESCSSALANTSQDIIEMDGASNNGVEYVRILKEQVNFLPSISKYKVYIIDEVHMLSTSAFNALLKTLEEPPKHVVFILCTTDPQKLPETIRSRCQRFDFHLIEDDKMLSKLKEVSSLEDISIKEDALRQIVELAQGGLRDGLSLLDQVSAYSAGEAISVNDVLNVSGKISFDIQLDIAVSLYNNDPLRAISLLKDLLGAGKDITTITESLIVFFKDVLMIKNLKESINKIGYDSLRFAELCDYISNQTLYMFIDTLSKALLDMKDSINKKMFVEVSFIKMTDKEIPAKLISISESPSFKEEAKEEPAHVEQPYVAPIVEQQIVEEAIKEEVVSSESVIPEFADEYKEEEATSSLFTEQPTESSYMENPYKESSYKDTNDSVSESISTEQPEEKEEESLFSLFNNEEDKEEVKVEPIVETRIVEEPVQEEPVHVEEPREEIIQHYEEPVSRPQPIHEEPISSEKKETISVSPAKYVEEVLNNANKEFKNRLLSELPQIIRLSRTNGNANASNLLTEVTITASSQKSMIFTTDDVAIANLLLKKETKEFICSLFEKQIGTKIDYICIPKSYWDDISSEFIRKYRTMREASSTGRIVLSETPCQGLKFEDETEKKEDDPYQELIDSFGDILDIK